MMQYSGDIANMVISGTEAPPTTCSKLLLLIGANQKEVCFKGVELKQLV